jgi:hypothetical protein
MPVINIDPLQPKKQKKPNKPDKPLQLLGKKYRVSAVMTMFANAIGNITFQPNRIN